MIQKLFSKDNIFFKPSYYTPLVLMITGGVALAASKFDHVDPGVFIGAFLLGGGMIGMLYRHLYLLKPAKVHKHKA